MYRHKSLKVQTDFRATRVNMCSNNKEGICFTAEGVVDGGN